VLYQMLDHVGKQPAGDALIIEDLLRQVRNHGREADARQSK
jgi:hypothetical protein